MAVIIQFPTHRRVSAASGEQQISPSAVVLPFAPVRKRRTRYVAGDSSPTEGQRVAYAVTVNASPRTDWLGDAVVRDDKGFVVTGHDLRVLRADLDWTLPR